MIGLNQAIIKLRGVKLPAGCALFSMQKDCASYDRSTGTEVPIVCEGCDETRCRTEDPKKTRFGTYPIEPEMLLLHRAESVNCFSKYPHRYIFDNAKFGIIWRMPSIISAIYVAKLLGAARLRLVSFDASTNGSVEYVCDGKQCVGETHPGYLSQRRQIDFTLTRCRFSSAKGQGVTPC